MTITEVVLENDAFEAALTSHRDETKHDQLATKQIQNIIVEWEQSRQSQDVSTSATCNLDDADNKEVKRTCGQLKLYGEYVMISLDSTCQWCWSAPDATASLTFRLAASASLIPLSQHKRLQKQRQKRNSGNSEKCEMDSKEDRKEQRIQNKVRPGMLDRLKKDSYIKQLLEAAASNTEDAVSCVVCEAELKQSFGSDGTVSDMEERVDISEDVVEGIRRAIFSQLEDNTSAIDLILSFPFLPRDVTKCHNGKDINIQLGHRAQLRLLEDAMFDACEREGEEEMLDDLTISRRKGAESSEEEDDDIPQKSPKQKISKR